MDKRDRKEQAFETLLAENLPAPPETVVAGVTPGHPALRRVVCVRRCGSCAACRDCAGDGVQLARLCRRGARTRGDRKSVV